MDRFIISILLLTSLLSNVLGQAEEEQLHRCILSREDHVLCQYTNRRLDRASANQYSIHHTRLRQSSSGFIECNVRATEQEIVNIVSFGDTSPLKFIYSPGFLREVQYDDQMRVEYIIQCAEDEFAYFDVTHNDIQGQDCPDQDGIRRCQDYVEVDRGDFGTSEFCGNSTSDDLSSQLELGSFKVVFRTSEETRGIGFQMLIICFKPLSETELEGCFNVSEFNESTVCNNVGSGSGIGSDDICPDGRRKREVDMKSIPEDNQMLDEEFLQNELLVKEMLGYSRKMRLRKDLVDFHMQWIRRKRSPEDVRFFERNILFAETLQYADENITVLDQDGNEEKYDKVLVLQTFNASGDILTFFGKAAKVQFPGPGVLYIVGRNAYLVGFVIDPRGLLPNEDEEQEILDLAEPLQNSINASLDVAPILENQTMEDLLLPGLIERRKRSTVTESAQREKRQTIDIDDEETLFDALRNFNACNPVLRSSARATFDYLRSENATFVDSLLTFTITCNLDDGFITCESDSKVPILSERTRCTIDNEEIECAPFNNCPVSFGGDVFRVTAINCNGQTGEATVRA